MYNTLSFFFFFKFFISILFSLMYVKIKIIECYDTENNWDTYKCLESKNTNTENLNKTKSPIFSYYVVFLLKLLPNTHHETYTP